MSQQVWLAVEGSVNGPKWRIEELEYLEISHLRYHLQNILLTKKFERIVSSAKSLLEPVLIYCQLRTNFSEIRIEIRNFSFISEQMVITHNNAKCVSWTTISN